MPDRRPATELSYMECSQILHDFLPIIQSGEVVPEEDLRYLVEVSAQMRSWATSRSTTKKAPKAEAGPTQTLQDLMKGL